MSSVAEPRLVGMEFQETYNRFVLERNAQALREGKGWALTHMVYVYEGLFPRTVVVDITNKFHLMHRLGRIGCATVFTYIGESEVVFYESSSFGEDGVPLVKKLPVDDVAFSFVAAICDIVDHQRIYHQRNVLLDQVPRIIVPSGFYVIRYTAQWAAGGEEDERVIVIDVVKADSIEQAMRELDKKVDQSRNCFFGFCVYQDGTWRHVVIRGKESRQVYNTIFVGSMTEDLTYEIHTV